jgi:AraC family ethanolamine operon transcriptional activator
MSDQTFFLHQHISDFEEFCTSALNWDLDYRQLECGPFSSEILTFGNNRVIFSRGKLGRRMLQRGGSPQGMFTFGLLVDQQTSIYWRNNDVSGKQLFIFPPDGELFSVTQSDFDVFVISLTERTLDQVCASFELPEFRALIKGHEVFQCDPQMLTSFKKFLLRTEQEYATMQQSIHNSMQFTQLENELSEQIVRLLADNALPISQKQPRKRDHALLTAVTYIHELGNNVITMPHLCDACNVSQRTLEYAFRERYGLTPKEYTLIHRLNNARKHLRTADPDKENVSVIARQHGFWHMGQFSSNYRKLFAELPSHTLKQYC